GYQDKFIWFCDAKLYARGVPFEKIQPALSPATATKPHYLLFAVYPHLTPQCKDLLDEWKSKNNPSFRIRLWEKKDIWKRLRRHPEVIRRHVPERWSEDLAIDAYLEETSNRLKQFATSVDMVWQGHFKRPLSDLIRLRPRDATDCIPRVFTDEDHSLPAKE